MTISENCFHHKWDTRENSFYYQRCFPIQKKCLILLDIVMNKFITVDEEERPPDFGALDGSDDSLDSVSFEDAVTVRSRSLQNYGKYFEKHLPLHKLATMRSYSGDQ